VSVYLRGNIYWIDFFFKGKRIQRSTRQGNKQTAIDAEGAMKIDLSRGLFKLDPEPPPPPPPRHTFGELLDRLKTQWELEKKDSPQNLSLIKMVRADWGIKVMEDLTPVDLQEYYVRRAKEEYKVATTNRIVQLLRRMFSLANELKLANPPKWPDFKLPSEKGNRRTGFVQPLQMRKLLAELPDDGLVEFVEWCYATGMRKSEAASLRWEWVNDTELTVPGEFCKSGEPHTIQFGGVLPAIIARCRARRAFDANGTPQFSQFLFHRGGEPVLEFRKSWKTACKKAGCGNLLLHDLRRSAIRDLLRAGVGESTAMRISGHRTSSVFKRYDIVSGDDVRRALDKQKLYRAG
jgi:integrase